jgi:hypothetical protein
MEYSRAVQAQEEEGGEEFPILTKGGQEGFADMILEPRRNLCDTEPWALISKKE